MAFLFNPLHYALHHSLRWDFATSFAFARNESWIPIARSEARRLSFHTPILIVERPREWTPVVPVAIEGLPTRSLDAASRWHKGAAPLLLALHPFKSVPDARTGAPLLAVAHDMEVVNADGRHAFFDAHGKPTMQVNAVLRRLQQIMTERRQLNDAAAALGEAGLLVPVPRLRDRQGREVFRTLDRAAFTALSSDQLARLGTRPQDAFMLASVLAYSSRLFVDEAEAEVSGHALVLPEDRSPTSPFYGDEMELVFNF